MHQNHDNAVVGKAHRTEALTRLLDDLAAFEMDVGQYYGDAEPMSVVDSWLTGKIESLRAFCQMLGWSELVSPMNNVTPLHANAVEALSIVQSFVIPEARRLIATTDIEQSLNPTQWFWDLVHPRIAALARPRFDAGFFGDAVEASFKEFNDAVKRIVKDLDGCELDGADLMCRAFSEHKPIIKLTTLDTVSDRNMQKGYMQIMAGAMTGVRNPKAHSNLNPSTTNALHLICFASHLMRTLDERLSNASEAGTVQQLQAVQ